VKENFSRDMAEAFAAHVTECFKKLEAEAKDIQEIEETHGGVIC